MEIPNQNRKRPRDQVPTAKGSTQRPFTWPSPGSSKPESPLEAGEQRDRHHPVDAHAHGAGTAPRRRQPRRAVGLGRPQSGRLRRDAEKISAEIGRSGQGEPDYCDRRPATRRRTSATRRGKGISPTSSISHTTSSSAALGHLSDRRAPARCIVREVSLSCRWPSAGASVRARSLRPQCALRNATDGLAPTAGAASTRGGSSRDRTTRPLVRSSAAKAGVTAR